MEKKEVENRIMSVLGTYFSNGESFVRVFNTGKNVEDVMMVNYNKEKNVMCISMLRDTGTFDMCCTIYNASIKSYRYMVDIILAGM